MHPSWLALADRAALMDTSRAAAELGWQPRYDTRAALCKFISGCAQERVLTARRSFRRGRPARSIGCAAALPVPGLNRPHEWGFWVQRASVHGVS